ncbi:MAG: cytidine deaminase [Chitinophagia bacterium]|nr:cytidine deaminase [Chitinophagia bacterium]
MTAKEIRIAYESYTSRMELYPQDRELLSAADAALDTAHAPYSRFRVGAAVRLSDGSILRGANQENASFPAGICAERVLLSAVSAVSPHLSVSSLAITYAGEGIDSSHPLAPCGVCRQTLAEYEDRYRHPIRLILSGQAGIVQVFTSACDLLPFRFSGTELPVSAFDPSGT